MKATKTLKDYMSEDQRKAMEGLPTYHRNCLKNTGVARPGKTARDRGVAQYGTGSGGSAVMTTAFREGDLVIMQNATYFTETDGYLGLVLSGLRQFCATDMRDMRKKVKWGYRVYVMHPDTRKTLIALPDQLRRPGENMDHLSREELQRMSRLVEELIS